MALVKRDPFARTELHREVVVPHGRTCDWCGGLNARRTLYKYVTESDGGRRFEHKGSFCSKSCHDSYGG
jgi:hypothetical protein